MAIDNTYQAIATTTLGTTASSITFSSISGSYTDLVLVGSIIGGAGNDCLIRLNSDTGANYSNTSLYGSGTAAASGRGSNSTFVYGNITSMDSGEVNTMIMSFNNYSNTTTYKTILNRFNSTTAGKYVTATVGLWRNTAAINSILVTTIGSGDFAVGTSVTIYGIKAA